MKITFRNTKDENKFKKFVCNNKETLDAFFAFGVMFKNPIARITFKILGGILDLFCPK